MTHLFLDCEWADDAGHQLVSLALVSEDGQHRFYSEVDPLPKQPTDWVRAVVYPLLQHGYAARQKPDFTRDLRTFLARFDAPEVLFDHATDGVLLTRALAGFDLPVNVIGKLGPAPSVTTILVQDEGVRDRIEAYFREHPDQARRRHHAGVDAEALRWGFILFRLASAAAAPGMVPGAVGLDEAGNLVQRGENGLLYPIDCKGLGEKSRAR